MDFTLRQLQHIRALARHRHFGRAADALAITQPALTRSVQALERTLGVVLFDRHRRGGVEPTEFGRLLLSRGRRILQGSEELVREIRLLQGREVGELTIDSGFYPADISVNRAVGRLLKRHPGLRLRVRITDWRQAMASVLARESDLAVAETTEATTDARLAVEVVGRHRFRFFCRAGHPLGRGRDVAIDELLSFPWIATRAPARITDLLPDDLGVAGRVDRSSGDFVPAVVVSDFAAARQVVGECDGLGVAPPSLMADLVARGFREIPCDAPWMRLHYGFVYLRERSLSPAATAFMAEVRAIEAD